MSVLLVPDLRPVDQLNVVLNFFERVEHELVVNILLLECIECLNHCLESAARLFLLLGEDLLAFLSH